MKCQHCPGYKNCEWRDPKTDECWYEPNDTGDIGKATVTEIQLQNTYKSKK